LFKENVPHVVARSVYAFAGETVTCENGHPICDFVETVYFGDFQRPDQQFGNWRQSKPQVGQLPLPVCEKCGAAFTDGMRYHIGEVWRTAMGARQ
jgi:hypothetical protein